MQEENASPTTVTIETPLTNETEAPVEALEETVETVANSEVEIAEIRAAENIAVAEINGDIERERIAAQERATEKVVQTEDEKWQEITSLKERVASLSETVETLASNLTAQLTPPQLETETPTNLTPQSTSVETSETPTENTLGSVVEKPGEEAAALVRRVRRAI